MILFRKRRRAIAADIHSRLGESDVVAFDDSALFFGVESRGAGQLRGNGCLGASSEQMLFVMWMPRREFSIPRDRITSIERTRSHLGKRIGRDLLKVSYTNDDGAPDSIAWYVTDLPLWESVLGTHGSTQ